ncbi:MAG: 3-hydroxyacyl-CoA dehydrogenase NAD-binding domain-containing protein [Pseudomonadota bacterium]
MSDASKVAVCGSGAMGAGIAQVAAQAGCDVVVYDSFPGALERVQEQVAKGAAALLKRGKIDEAEAQAMQDRVRWTDSLDDLSDRQLIIEAVIENFDIKAELFAKLEGVVAQDCVLATNTSSLGVSALASKLEGPERFIGLHFFNPAAIMKLVEVVPGLRSAPAIIEAAAATMQGWGKTAVVAKDVPGFIVNRVARPFYSEGWQAYEEEVASAATIDFLYRDLAGFRMGPLELGDLIGHDINSTAAQSVYDSYAGRTRFRPSLTQAALAKAGLLGRKSGQGIYDYGEGAEKPASDFADAADAGEVKRGPFAESFGEIGIADDSLAPFTWIVDGMSVRVTDGRSARQCARDEGRDVAVLDYVRDIGSVTAIAYSASSDGADKAARALITALGKKPVTLRDRPGALVFRTILQLVNAGADAVRDWLCSAEDVDTALRLGVNYPFGPMDWVSKMQSGYAVAALENIARETGDDALFRPNHILRNLTAG